MRINNEELINAVDSLKLRKLIKRDSELAEALGYSKGVISEYLNNKKVVSDSFMRKLYDEFPQARKKVAVYAGEQEENFLAVAERTVPYKSNARRVYVADKGVMNVPVITQYAFAGYLRGYGDAEFVDSLPKMPWLVDKEYKGTYLTFEVRGDSMDDGSRDSYLEGDMLLCREIARDHWKNKLHIRDWDFVIVHKTDGILVKRIVDHNTTKGVITLHSLNDLYDNFEVNLKDVAQIFNIVQVARKK